MQQTPSTGVSAWKSALTTYPGQEMEDLDETLVLRAGDRRIGRYMRWAVEHERESFRILPAACHSRGMEFHASIRANLFFSPEGNLDFAKMVNGSFWWQNQQLRQQAPQNDPGARPWKLDYARPEARGFLLGLIREGLALSDEIDGFNLDFTRWPSVMDPEHNTVDDFLTLVRETADLLTELGRARGRKIAFSVSLVEGYHAGTRTLMDQKIDFEALLRLGVLDFICLETYDIAPYAALAAARGVPLFGIADGESPHSPGGFRTDPLWRLPDGSMQDDPRPGEEFIEQPPLNSGSSPEEAALLEYDRLRQGCAGLCYVNRFLGSLSLRQAGHTATMWENLKEGRVYGQEYGPQLFDLT
jgi:hypothetical protein